MFFFVFSAHCITTTTPSIFSRKRETETERRALISRGSCVLDCVAGRGHGLNRNKKARVELSHTLSSTCSPGGSDCFSLSAFSRSFTHRVYRYLLQRTLNFTTSFDFLILTAAGSERARGCQQG